MDAKFADVIRNMKTETLQETIRRYTREELNSVIKEMVREGIKTQLLQHQIYSTVERRDEDVKQLIHDLVREELTQEKIIEIAKALDKKPENSTGENV